MCQGCNYIVIQSCDNLGNGLTSAKLTVLNYYGNSAKMYMHRLHESIVSYYAPLNKCTVATPPIKQADTNRIVRCPLLKWYKIRGYLELCPLITQILFLLRDILPREVPLYFLWDGTIVQFVMKCICMIS